MWVLKCFTKIYIHIYIHIHIDIFLKSWCWKSEKYILRLGTKEWQNVVVIYKTVIQVVVIPVETEGIRYVWTSCKGRIKGSKGQKIA